MRHCNRANPHVAISGWVVVSFYLRFFKKRGIMDNIVGRLIFSEHRAIPNTNLGCPKAEALAVVGGDGVVEAEQSGFGVE